MRPTVVRKHLDILKVVKGVLVDDAPSKAIWLYIIFVLCIVRIVFTALHVMQTRYRDENSVRLSVCLSHACIVTKRKKGRSRFLYRYHTKEHLA